MAIDTQDKRRSARSQLWDIIPPVPDGGINNDDRRHVAGVYRGDYGGEYYISGNVNYDGASVSGAKIVFGNKSTPGTHTITSTESDSNFSEGMVNLSGGWNDGDTLLIAVTHNGRRAQHQTVIDVTTYPIGENIGTLHLKAHWGCGG